MKKQPLARGAAFVCWLALVGLTASPGRALAQGRGEPDDSEVLTPGADLGAPSNNLDLVVGETKTISALGVKNYSEGAPGIVDIKLTTDGSKFVVVGKKAGSTSLLLINKDGTQQNWIINCFSRSPDAVKQEVEELLEKTPGIRVRRVGARFFIEGGVSSEAEAQRVERIAALYPGQVESLVVAGSGAADRKINIRIDFFFVQYDKTTGYGVGVDWPARIGGGNIAQNQITFDFIEGTATTATASIVNQPLPALDIAANRGWAKVLKQSTVITINGSEATFESGGEQNFTIQAGLSAGIQAISFGTKVTVLPRLDPKTGDLEVGVNADVSDLLPPAPGTNLPSRAISQLKTLVRLKLGQSIVLSGIRTKTQRQQIRGLPFLSQIPVLGLLFGSHSGNTEDVEGAVFIIPTAVESVPRPALEMVNLALEQYESFSGNMRAVDSYNKQPKEWAQPR